jgi:hypothetical protein
LNKPKLRTLRRGTSGRGQLFTVDVIFAFILLLTLFGAITTLSTVLSKRTSEIEDDARLSETAANAMNQLVGTSGKPNDWNLLANFTPANVDSIGLALEKNVLDADKVARFFSLVNSSHADLKAILGINEPGYDFYVALYYPNNTAIYSSGTRAPPQKKASVTQRIALLSGNNVKIRLGVWID